MEAQLLGEYALGRLRSGVQKSELREELTALGWTDEEIEGAYRAAVVLLGAPVPSEQHRPTLSRKAGAVDVVINFFSFILLGIVATALGTLFFQVINSYFPDALDATYGYAMGYSSDAIHYATAALIIGYPLYYFAMRLWFRKFREDEGRVESKLSKWLTYVVLLVTAVTIVGDLIVLVYTLLQGEVTMRFFLKALVILAIAGGIFGFYYLERKKIQYRADISRLVFQRFGVGVTSFVVVGILLGFLVGGSPMTERERTFDATRANHLSSLANCIEQYALSLGHLPATLADFRQSSEYNYCLAYTTDPETGADYEYRVVTALQNDGTVVVGEFELCAQFTLDSVIQNRTNSHYGMQTIWYEHTAGRSCDTVKARLTQPATSSIPMPPTPLSPVQKDTGI